MPKPLKKDTYIKVYCTADEKKQIKNLTALSNKETMSKFILDTILDVTCSHLNTHSLNSVAALLKKHFKEVKAFEHQQKITMHIITQLCLYISNFTKSEEDIMDFYEDAHANALEKYGKEA